LRSSLHPIALEADDRPVLVSSYYRFDRAQVKASLRIEQDSNFGFLFFREVLALNIIGIIIQLIAGAVGGNAAGAALKDKSLGGTGNSIAGAIGGIVVAQVIQRLTGVAVTPDAAAAASSSLDIGTIIKDLIASGAGGAILTAIIGMIKNR
jgi:hypothetical protein